MIFLTLGEMMALPFINTVIMGKANEHNRGKFAAAFAVTWSAAQVLGPGGGALITQTWGYNALWITLIIVCISCALAFKFINRK